jgi:hypothetical protein
VSEQIGARGTVAVFGALAAASSLVYLALTSKLRAGATST